MVKETTEEDLEEGWGEEAAKAKLAVETQEDIQEDNEEEEEAEEEGYKVVKAKPKKTAEVTSNKKQIVTYSAYQVPERIGVLNNKTKQPVGENILELLALILTKIERIEEGVYGN